MLLRWLLLLGAAATVQGACGKHYIRWFWGFPESVRFSARVEGYGFTGSTTDNLNYCYDAICDPYIYFYKFDQSQDTAQPLRLDYPQDTTRSLEWYKAASNANEEPGICYQDYLEIVDLTFTFYGPNAVRGKSEFDSSYGQCKNRVMKHCGASQCNGGQYASEYAVKNAFNYVSKPIQCLPCQPGTFNACLICEVEGQTCKCPWTIPSDEDDTFITETVMSLNGKAPVGACFPCDYLRSTPYMAFHAKDPVVSNQIRIFNDPIICPGNLDGGYGIPQRCPAGSVSNSAYTECVCPGGQYRNATSQTLDCLDCEEGNYCTDGLLRVCPDHQYQDETGTTACKSCVAPARAGANGRPVFTCDGNERVRQCVGGNPAYHTRFPICIPCNTCYRAFVNMGADKVPCYET